MKITAIKAQVKNANRVSVFVDLKYSFSLNLDQLLQEKLKKDLEIDENRVEALQKLSDEGKLKQRVLDWLMIRPHSTKEFRDYMYKKKAEKDLSEAWIEEFTAKRYLDDKSFAEWFAEQRVHKNKSQRAIESELRAKGISVDVIREVLGSSQVDNKEAIKALIQKIGNRPRYRDRKKLITYLLGKGFNYSDIKEVLEDS